MIVVHTWSGSIYEFDDENKRVRRLYGVNAPTDRQGTDGEWRDYSGVLLTYGGGLVIMWAYAYGVLQTTATSPVVKLQMASAVENSKSEIDSNALKKLITEREYAETTS